MPSRTSILPSARKALSSLGDNLRMARLRRRLSARQVAERAGISRPTLAAIEKGSENVGMGAYVNVIMVLGLLDDLVKVAADDELGRKLQDSELIVRQRAPGRKRQKE